MTMICSLKNSSYSSRVSSIIPLLIEIKNRKEKEIYSIIIQLIQIISLNGIKYENEIFITEFNQIKTIYELNLPINLPPTYIPNENGQPDNVPLIVIIYNLRITAQIKSANTPNLRLSVPIGIH